MTQTNGTSQKEMKVDAVIIGAGLSGIATLYRLRKLGLKAVILEAGSEFGGVWNFNRYPGARVDSEFPYYQLNIPEVYNTFSFSERFPGHEEIRKYMAHVDKTLNISKDTIFDARVNDCSWNKQSSRWTIKTEQGHVVEGKYLILCTGLLHRRHYPDFPGLKDFKGEVHHSGFWPSTLSTKDKKVALIGAGATAVQITQEIAKDAKELTILMRRPSYCLPMYQRSLTELENRGLQTYFDVLLKAGRNSAAGFPANAPITVAQQTPEEREAYMEDRWTRGGFQFLLAYADVMVNKDSSKAVYDFWRKKVCERMKPGKKRDLMAPAEASYYFGTKRTPLEQDYYEMIDKDSVDVVNMDEQKIRTFTESGLVYENGSELNFDLLVLATGFDSFSGSVTRMGLKNIEGVDIKNLWEKEGIKSYLGMTIGGFPNCFMVYSPHAPTALSNGPTIIESQADMITDFISKLEGARAKSATPMQPAQEEWVNMVDGMAQQTLLPLTNSWWSGGNIPGKKTQMMTYVLGIQQYEATCREHLDALKGFEVEYDEGAKTLEDEIPVKAATAT